MKKLLFSFFCVFALESNLSAQRIDITNAGVSSIESNREWVYVRNKMVYNPSVPFFTRTNPLAESYPLLYGMSIYTLYEASETDLVATIDLLKIDVQTLVASNDGVASKKPYVRIKALNDEESWNTTFKRDGSEIQQTQRIFDFDTEAQAQKFIAELKACVKVSQIFSVEAQALKQQSGANADANTLENSKKRIKLLERAEALIAGKKYTQLEIILASEKYEQYEQNISNLVEYNIKVERYVPTKNAPQDAPTQIYNNLAKLNAIRKTFQAKYKTFEENYYPSLDKRDWGITKRLNSVNARGGFATSFPATLAEYQAFVAKVQEDKQKESKKLENANAIDASGNSALMNAIKAKDLEKVKSLINASADVTFINPKTKSSVLKYALEIKDIPIIKELIQTKVIKKELEYFEGSRGKVYHNELIYVIEKNDAELYQLFEAFGTRAFKQVEADYTDKDGNYPWMIAYNFGNFKKALLIYLSGENNEEKQRKKDGYTILMIAIEKNDIPAAIEFATLTSAGLNLTNNDGYTALMMAAERGQKEVVEIILTRTVYKKNSSGQATPESYDPNFVSDKGKMKGKKAIDVAKNKDIKKLLTKK